MFSLKPEFFCYENSDKFKICQKTGRNFQKFKLSEKKEAFRPNTQKKFQTHSHTANKG